MHELSFRAPSPVLEKPSRGLDVSCNRLSYSSRPRLVGAGLITIARVHVLILVPRVFLSPVDEERALCRWDAESAGQRTARPQGAYDCNPAPQVCTLPRVVDEEV